MVCDAILTQRIALAHKLIQENRVQVIGEPR